MNYALFLGCQIPARLPAYEVSARKVLAEALGIGLIDIKEFTCCGYPLRNFDYKSFVLASARNLALAEKNKLDILALCSCCYGSLRKVEALLHKNPDLKAWVNDILGGEGLQYEGKMRIRHFLSVLAHDMGIDEMADKISNPFKELKIAAHYGCHALRPSDVVAFDDPLNPSIFDKLVELTGAKSVEWSMQLECCGAPLSGVNDTLAMNQSSKKIINAKQAGADYLCTACPYCQMQFDMIQKKLPALRGVSELLPSIAYPQLIGLSMGMTAEELKLSGNEISLMSITQFR
jgi:heterodisulfide reductase subunit B